MMTRSPGPPRAPSLKPTHTRTAGDQGDGRRVLMTRKQCCKCCSEAAEQRDSEHVTPRPQVPPRCEPARRDDATLRFPSPAVMTRIPCRGRARFEEELSSGHVCHSVPALPVRPPFRSAFPLFRSAFSPFLPVRVSGLPVRLSALPPHVSALLVSVTFPSVCPLFRSACPLALPVRASAHPVRMSLFPPCPCVCPPRPWVRSPPLP